MKRKVRWQTLVFLMLLCLPLFFISVQDTQSWGDDFAQYITEAQNIAEGRAYDAGLFLHNPLNSEYAPPSYPPGFPLLLAPVIYFFGVDIQAMLLLISALMVLLAVVLFYLYRSIFSERSAFFLALLSVYAASVLDLKWYVLSDLPLLFFSSLYLTLCRRTEPGLIANFFLAVLLAFCCLIRSQAIVLAAAEILVLFTALIRHKKFLTKVAQRLIFFIAIYAGLFLTILKGGAGGSSFYLQLFDSTPGRYVQLIKENTSYLFELLQSFLIFRTDNGYLYRFEILIGTFFALVFLVALMRRLLRKPDLFSWFALMMCLLILILPVRQGLRYLLPLLPIFILFTADFIKQITKGMNLKLPRLFLPAICYLYFLCLLPKLKDKPYDANWTPYTAKDQAVFSWLKKNLDTSTTIVSTKPRALRLFTGLHTTIPAWMKPHPENTAFYHKHGIRHFLVRTDLDWDLIERYLRESEAITDTLRLADTYTLFIVKGAQR